MKTRMKIIMEKELAEKEYNLVMPPEEENEKMIKYAEKCGYMTVWEILQEYGIYKQKTYKAIKAGKLLAFMKGSIDKHGKSMTEIKWYIVKNEAFNDFVAKNKTKS